MISLPQSLLPGMGTNHALLILLRGKTSREVIQYIDGHPAGWAWSMASWLRLGTIFSVHASFPIFLLFTVPLSLNHSLFLLLGI